MLVAFWLKRAMVKPALGLLTSVGSPSHLLLPFGAGLRLGGATQVPERAGGGVRHACCFSLEDHCALSVCPRQGRAEEVDHLQSALLLPGTLMVCVVSMALKQYLL